MESDGNRLEECAKCSLGNRSETGMRMVRNAKFVCRSPMHRRPLSGYWRHRLKWSQMKSDEVWCSPNGKFCILIHNLWIRKGSQSLFFRVPNRLKEPWLFDADFQCRVPVFILAATECSHLLALTQNFWVKPPAKTLAKPSVHYSYVLRVALIRKAADNSSPSNLDALPLLQSVGSSLFCSLAVLSSNLEKVNRIGKSGSSCCSSYCSSYCSSLSFHRRPLDWQPAAALSDRFSSRSLAVLLDPMEVFSMNVSQSGVQRTEYERAHFILFCLVF